MPIIENDHVIEQVTSAAPHETLCNAILPRALKASSLGLSAETAYRCHDLFVEIAATVEDEIARCGVVRKCLAQLLDYPCTCRILRRIEMDDAPPVVR